MKTGPNPFIITFSIYSMETGRHMILQSRIFQATNSFSGRVSMFFQSRSHIIFTLRPPLKDRLNPSLFLYIHSIMHMSYRFDHMCCSILIYGSDGFL